MPAVPNLRAQFLLDPAVRFFNHGSFGATPRPVLAARQAWLERLERQPVRFLAREFAELMHTARSDLGAYLACAADDLCFLTNATFGVNLIARSLTLQAGDEVLASDHEYGACERAWQAACARSGARYRRQPVPLPATSQDDLLEHLWAGVGPRTRVIFLSHITSPTALRMPVEALCARARAAGILTVIDAAHSIGQLPVNLGTLGADFVVGNLHKWFLAPKGAAFLYARRECQPHLRALVTSWNTGGAASGSTGSTFLDDLQWSGTHDPSPALCTSAAIDFQHRHDWPALGRACHQRLADLLADISALTGLPACYPAGSDLYAQMAVARLPDGIDPATTQRRLYDDYRIEIPLIAWNGQNLLRISLQAYNSEDDCACLFGALQALLK